MTIYVPWGAIAIFVVLFFFYSANRRNRLRKEERKERLQQMQDEMLVTLRNRTRKEQDSVNEDIKNSTS